MCGRYILKTPVTELGETFGFEDSSNLPARYNVAPMQEMPVIGRDRDSGGRALRMMRWGLVPFWANEEKIGNKMINARSDGVASKPAFRQAFAKRRCLIPADGFYEWHTEDGVKQPYLIRRADQQPFVFAGLWEGWRGPKDAPEEEKRDPPLKTYTIITTDAGTLMSRLHHRVPVILPQDAWDAWLDPESGKDTLQSLLKPAPEEGWEAVPVDRRVGNVRNDETGLIEPVGDNAFA